MGAMAPFPCFGGKRSVASLSVGLVLFLAAFVWVLTLSGVRGIFARVGEGARRREE
jgi:hypothetical protein